MTDPVFLFGSFTEDEVHLFQPSPVESSSEKKIQSPNRSVVKENGFHSPKKPSLDSRSQSKTKVQSISQNGHGAASKGVSTANVRVIGNGRQPEPVVNTPGKTAGHGVVKKHPTTTSTAATTAAVAGRSGQQGDLKNSGDRFRIPAVSHAPPEPTKGTITENGDHADWLVVHPYDVAYARSVGGSGVAAPVPTKQNGAVPSRTASTPGPLLEGHGVTQKFLLGKEGGRSSELLMNASPSTDSEAVPAELMPKSWAALVGVTAESLANLKSPGGAKGKGKGNLKGHLLTQQNEVIPVTALSGEIWFKSLRDAEASGRRLAPRGLINTGNSCFLNSTVQALLSCSAFTHLLQVLKARNIPQTGFPTLRAFVDFSAEFESAPDQNAAKLRREVDTKVPLMDVGRPFAPAMFDVVLQSFTPDQPTRAAGRNRQEDAQEFLSFLIDRMHEEILRLQGNESPSVQSTSSVTSVEDEDWEMVGPKQRTAVTRTHTLSESAITDIFGGQLRSVVKTKGNKASATVQPFLVLHLDIVPDFVHSIEDGLRFFAAPESLEGYKPSTAKLGEVVTASKSVKIQTLPRVLILHLMRFSYGSGGSSKLHKAVHFPLEVTLGRELLSSPIGSGSEARRYELVATVSHHGKDPSVGHYTADSKQSSGQWLRFDDGVVSAVSVSRVLQEQAYVLFYKRLGF